jgi:hypothetical protein
MLTLLEYSLIKTTRRLTFDIHYQHPSVIWTGDDDGDYMRFVASNGYEVISRSRMDIQTERLWLLGAKHEEEVRSGSMVFSSDEKRDAAYARFVDALNEWATSQGGVARRRGDTSEPQAVRYGWDGYGYSYLDNGSGSDWLERHPDAERLYTAQLQHLSCSPTEMTVLSQIHHAHANALQALDNAKYDPPRVERWKHEFERFRELYLCLYNNERFEG